MDLGAALQGGAEENTSVFWCQKTRGRNGGMSSWCLELGRGEPTKARDQSNSPPSSPTRGLPEWPVTPHPCTSVGGLDYACEPKGPAAG